MTTDEDSGESEYNSGPFCRHWSDPADCDETCGCCGHRCVDHAFGDGAEPACSECDCEAWVEVVK